MSSDTLQSAIASIRSGDKETGKRLLAEVIRDDPRNETAWLWISSVIDSDKHRRYCLERVLQINPQNRSTPTSTVAEVSKAKRGKGATPSFVWVVGGVLLLFVMMACCSLLIAPNLIGG